MTIPLNAYILSGGQSRRFGSDKCLAEINGKSLTRIIYDNLNPCFKSVSILGKEMHFQELPFLEDTSQIQCPMNGIYTAMLENKGQWLFICSCDMPRISIQTIEQLYNSIQGDDLVVLAKSGDKIHTTFGFYHSRLIPQFSQALENEHYKLLTQVLKVPHRFIDIEYYEELLNINYPEDLPENN